VVRPMFRASAAGIALLVVLSVVMFELDSEWLAVSSGLIAGALLARVLPLLLRRWPSFGPEHFWVIPFVAFCLGLPLQVFYLAVTGLVAASFMQIDYMLTRQTKIRRTDMKHPPPNL